MKIIAPLGFPARLGCAVAWLCITSAAWADPAIPAAPLPLLPGTEVTQAVLAAEHVQVRAGIGYREVQPCGTDEERRHGFATVSPRYVDPKRAAQFATMIEAAARRYRVPASLVHSVVASESAYDPAARSSKGATGLMQLMPGTAKRFGVVNPADPRENLDGGVRYLRWLMERFDHDLPLVLAAYNAGEGAVAKYANSIPPYPETRNYVAQVMATFNQQCSFPSTTLTAAVAGATVFPTPATAPAATSGSVARTSTPVKTVGDVLNLGAFLLQGWLPRSAAQ